MSTHHYVITVLLALFCLTSCQEPVQVDLLVHNATIYTLEDGEAKVEAMAIDKGIIVATGSEHEILNKYAAKEVIDAKKQFIYPGFNDAHSHFLGYGTTKLYSINLLGTASLREVCERVQTHLNADTSTWITGRGWDQTKWENQDFPDNQMLDSLFPDKYIVLKRLDGHALIATSNVLELAGIDASTKVNGGKILLSNRKPTGVLIDEAMNLVEQVIPPLSKAQKASALRRAAEDCWAVGLTSVTDAGLAPADVNLIDKLQSDGALPIRIYAMYAAHDSILGKLPSLVKNTPWLRTNSVKIYADGALGSRGALLSAPYADDSSNTGLLITPRDSLKKWALACQDAGFQLCVHCIGDSSARLVLQCMGEVLGGTNDRRWRIEHAQVVAPGDRSLFAQYNVIPSMQPTHATSDMGWAAQRLGPNRIDWAYALNSMKNANGMIALGTDFPVEGIDPLMTFYAATVRKNSEGHPPEGFLMKERLNRMDALKGMTIWPAMSSFEEELKGTISQGKVADFVILDTDLIECESEQILQAKVLQTRINGEQVYAQ